MRAFAAGRALAAAFVGKRSGNCCAGNRSSNTFHPRRPRRRCLNPRQPTVSGRGEIELRVEFVGGHYVRCSSPPGTTAFALRPFHTPRAVFLDQLPHGNAQRRFVTAGPVDVAADAVELGAVAARIARVFRIGGRADRFEPRRRRVRRSVSRRRPSRYYSRPSACEKALRRRETAA